MPTEWQFEDEGEGWCSEIENRWAVDPDEAFNLEMLVNWDDDSDSSGTAIPPSTHGMHVDDIFHPATNTFEEDGSPMDSAQMRYVGVASGGDGQPNGNGDTFPSNWIAMLSQALNDVQDLPAGPPPARSGVDFDFIEVDGHCYERLEPGVRKGLMHSEPSCVETPSEWTFEEEEVGPRCIRVEMDPNEDMLLVDASDESVEISLPACEPGKTFTIKRGDCNVSNVVRISAGGNSVYLPPYGSTTWIHNGEGYYQL